MGFRHVAIVGGEPYVRPKLLKQAAETMRSSWIVTSGTVPLLRVNRATHFVSVDGADAETHDSIRKSKGLYERILKNLKEVRSEGNFPAYIHTVLNRRNYLQIRDILSVWKDNGLVDGVVFSTLTPIRNGNDNELRLSREQRVWAVRQLRKTKEDFGSFLCMTNEMISSFHPSFTALQTPDTCSTARFIPSYNASGNRMKQCILSDRADCSECGCIITSMLDTFVGASKKGAIKKALLLSDLIQN